MIVDQKVTAGAPTSGLKAINLALQGGGSYGAFMWGVLDRLLEENRLSFDGITATSIGAINAVVLADGLAEGGREGAKNLLKTFWRKMSGTTSFSILVPSFIDQLNPNFGSRSFTWIRVLGHNHPFYVALSTQSVRYKSAEGPP